MKVMDSNNTLKQYIEIYKSKADVENAQRLFKCAKEVDIEQISSDTLHSFINATGNHDFIGNLGNISARNEWAELIFRFIQKSNYSLLDMFTSRVQLNPNKALFTEYIAGKEVSKSYQRVNIYTREIAAALLDLNEGNPNCAIFCENSSDSASIDLACLFYDIFVTPLNINFSEKILKSILDQIDIDVFITDTKERIERLRKLREISGKDFIIITINEKININGKNEFYLKELITRLSNEKIVYNIETRSRKALDDVATLMFTSGSTGIPKGIAFSIYNLVSKRFARGAALPEVGKDEKLLCYLPLFHTFGRYLEMLGMIYWNGTYVFTGSHSKDTLFELFPKVKPTGFISIPLRWAEIDEKSQELADSSGIDVSEALQIITGGNLKWGLSAAGYLEPKIFKFFQRNRIELMSGFGMTEATGGITMTPPGEYRHNSVGKPLPGVYLSFGAENELLIRGHYVARYLENTGQYGKIPFPHEDNDYNLPTGDIFKKHDDGHFEIIDRVKDIYKNNKGQTVAPKNAENKFEGVPGFKRTFLVGDGKPYNILFVVQDSDDVILSSEPEEIQHEYFRKIINEANAELEPYDRIVNFTVLDRDFKSEMGELTAKGSYNRKIIEKNFASKIEELYQTNYTDLKFHDFIIRIPRWVFRDLGIMENDILKNDEGLYNRANTKKLKLKIHDKEKRHIQIGNLEYRILGDVIDLGRLALKPDLWCGNPQLIKFVPYKEGWETKNTGIFEHVFIPFIRDHIDIDELPAADKIRNHKLNEVNRIVSEMLYSDENIALESLQKLTEIHHTSDERISLLIRKRIGALARHESETVRTKAYKTLLLDDPSPDYSKSFPAFVESGLSFLNNDSIAEIAKGKMEKRRLEALRIRLRSYREQLDWDNDKARRAQFITVFKLLSDFALQKPEFYASIRYEFADWILFEKDQVLASEAKNIFILLFKKYEEKLDIEESENGTQFWQKKIIFDDDIEESDRDELMNIVVNNAFVRQSVMLAYDEHTFNTNDISDGGLWISKLDRTTQIKHYRFCISATKNRQFDLQIYIHSLEDLERNLESVYWHISIAGYPFSTRTLPKFGVCRPEMNVRSSVYNGELNLWDKLREFSGIRIAEKTFGDRNKLRRLYLEAMTTFIKAWNHSGQRIIPGKLLPENIIVSELDFRDGGLIHSLKHWKRFTALPELFTAFERNFYHRAVAHYNWLEDQLDKNWIFDSFQEALGEAPAKEILNKTYSMLNDTSAELEIKELLKIYIEKNKDAHYIPLKVINAITRYSNWIEQNPEALQKAKFENLLEMHSLYNLSKLSEYLRYYLYRHTYFDDADDKLKHRFDELLEVMNINRERPATEMVELSALRDLLHDDFDKSVFTKMVFPELKSSEDIDIVLTEERKSVIIQSYIKDRYGVIYNFRQPSSPQEIGQIYRIFFQDKFPKEISESDRFFVATDEQENVIGGICYKIQDKDSVFIDGTVVVPKLKGRGIGSAIVQDFCGRVGSMGFSVCKTYYFMQEFYGKHGFKLDKGWGAMVKFLASENSPEIKGQYCRI